MAGTFYAGTESALRRQIEGCFRHPAGPGALLTAAGQGPRRVLGVLSPHAGYKYSGPVAVHGFSQVAADGTPELVVILGPDHYGVGADVAISRHATWRTPLGETPVATDLAEALAASGLAQFDDRAHEVEHSLEVQLPFLQYLFGSGFRVLPIAMANQSSDTSLRLGAILAPLLAGANALLVASSDFSHYVPHDEAVRRDREALVAIGNLEPERLPAVIDLYNVTMCGPGPVMAVMSACRELGATQVSILKYATSGDTSGDRWRVVGYASVAFRWPKSS